mmetsp:Transcript_25208/g.39332  ORF Transcript_25208/g.39332 Transcript_25208/m.39332 type:complete len:123 (-) Transcript_25208:16-384(-)
MTDIPKTPDGHIRPSTLIDEYMKNVEQDAKARNKPLKLKTSMLARPWIPYACVAALVAIWIPDDIKVLGLQYAMEKLDQFKFRVHREYWKMTMSTSDYDKLMKQIAEGVEKKDLADRPDCPL